MSVDQKCGVCGKTNIGWIKVSICATCIMSECDTLMSDALQEYQAKIQTLEKKHAPINRQKKPYCFGLRRSRKATETTYLRQSKSTLEGTN